jgi:hypothetical protein
VAEVLLAADLPPLGWHPDPELRNTQRYRAAAYVAGVAGLGAFLVGGYDLLNLGFNAAGWRLFLTVASGGALIVPLV